MRAALKNEIAHYERCCRLLDRVDVKVFAAGMELCESEDYLARWLCAPARALGGKIPLHVMRSKKGRELVARILGAIEHGSYL
jgi:uncharacterized protein (DUF2384 family)